MDYMKNYRALCSGRQSLGRHRSDSTYYESHHITPKSLGGSDDSFNLVLLTAKEHYIAHLLLFMHYKQVGGEALRKMAFALVGMTSGLKKRKTYKIQSSRSYAVLKEAAMLASLGRKVEDTVKYKQPKSNKHKQAIRQARLAAPPRSKESREKMRKSALNRGDNFTGNYLQAKCPNCLKEGQKNAMLRWHFNNCKVRKEVANAQLA